MTKDELRTAAVKAIESQKERVERLKEAHGLTANIAGQFADNVFGLTIRSMAEQTNAIIAYVNYLETELENQLEA